MRKKELLFPRNQPMKMFLNQGRETSFFCVCAFYLFAFPPQTPNLYKENRNNFKGSIVTKQTSLIQIRNQLKHL